jgi:two-component system, cell cycle sensor histidine kinase and response regulator CckA
VVAANQKSRQATPLGRHEVELAAETILVAEDEEMVRGLLARMLRLRGYRVIEAASGREAVAAAASGDRIDLLITDVVMTDMNGRELANRLTASRPSLPVLFISGYTDESIAHHGVLEPGVRLLEKPFSAETLVGRVREILGGESPSA